MSSIGDVGAVGPRRTEVWAAGEHRQDPRARGSRSTNMCQELQRGRVDPVQVFDDEAGPAAALPCGRGWSSARAWSAASAVRGAVSGNAYSAPSGMDNRSRKAASSLPAVVRSDQEPLQFGQLLRRRVVALEAQDDSLEQIDHRIERGVLVVRRTLAVREPRLLLRRRVRSVHAPTGTCRSPLRPLRRTTCPWPSTT